MDFFEKRHHFMSTAGIQSGGRLIQNQYARFSGNDAGNGDTAAFASAEFKGRTLPIAFVQTDFMKRGMGFLNRFFGGNTKVFGSEGNIFFDGFFEQLIFRKLEHKTGPLTQAFKVFDAFVRLNHEFIHHHFTRRGKKQGVDVLD